MRTFIAIELPAQIKDKLSELQTLLKKSGADVKWVEPNLVVQVTALEVTHDGHLRAPVFLRTRDDKDPQECTIDQIWT